MEFAINYNNGYVVCLVAYDECWKRKRFFPLRNFGDHQGDARLFKEVDCPDLSDVQLRLLIRSYKSSVSYKRINNKKFIPDI